MKSASRKISVVIIALVTFFYTTPASGQLEGDFLKAGLSDGMLLMESYITPFANAFGAAFNSAWYSTAKPHNLGGFDLTLTVSAGMVPDVDKKFDLSDLDFQKLTLVDPGQSIAPTVAGEKNTGPSLELVENIGGFNIPIVEFESPAGSGLGFVPAPMLQAGIGMPLGSEIKIRYIPKTPISEGSVSLLGGGLVHSISQYIKPLKVMPINISVFGGYSKLSASIPVSMKPDNYFYMVEYTPTDFLDQFVSVDVAAWNVSLIGSVDIPLVSAFVGIGYGKTTTILDLEGNLPVPFADPMISTTGPVYDDAHVITNFDELRIDNFSGLRLNVGAKLKLGVFTIHGDYTRAMYNVFTAGIGVSFR
ncbi:MAG: DUF6588 family protein [Bacteroidales bacterium]